MTMRRLDRKRLFEVEKLGQNVDIGAGVGMKNAIISATQHRQGQQLITDIVVDLGTSKDVVKTGGTGTGVPVGTEDASGTAELSYLAQLTEAVFGRVTQVETICLEVPTDGALVGTTSGAYQLEIGDGDGKIGVAVGNPVAIHGDMNSIGEAIGSHQITSAGDGAFVANTLTNKYLYIAKGAGNATTAATASITVDDTFVTGQLDSGVSRIVVIATDGTVVEHVFASGTNKGSSSSGTIGYGGTPTLAEMATSIAAAIDNHGKFNASATDKVVNITQGTAGVGGNTTIALVNGVSAAGAALSADLTIASFSGGTTAGTSTAMTAGKFLIRVTGFVTPDDL